MRPGDWNRRLAIAFRVSDGQGHGGPHFGIFHNDPIVDTGGAVAGKFWYLADGSSGAFNHHDPFTDESSNRPGCNSFSRVLRVRTTSDLHIEVRKFTGSVPTAHGAGANAELRESLNHAVFDVQRVAALPVDTVAVALVAKLQVFQPSNCGGTIERARRRHVRSAKGRITTDRAGNRRVEAIQEKRLVVIHLYVGSKRSA